MGVGRNLSYHKSLFFKNRGFASHYHISSGDDDLFVNEVGIGKNTTIELSTESHTISLPKTSFTDWFKQKQRHMSAGSLYKRDSKTRIAGELISRIMIYTTLVIICVVSPWKWPILAAFGLLTMVKLIVFKLGMRRLNEKFLLLPSLLLDPVLPVLLGVIRLSNLFVTKHQTWS